MKLRFFSTMSLAAAILFFFAGATRAKTGVHSMIGRGVPAFRVKSGDGRVMHRGRLRGKITIIFYDTRKSAWRNRPLKRALEKKYYDLPRSVRRNIVRLPVIDCSRALLTTFWRRALRDHSREQKITIYGDWDGSMKKSFRMKPDDSNIIIIDSEGVVRYFKTGALPAREADAIIAFLSGGAPKS